MKCHGFADVRRSPPGVSASSVCPIRKEHGCSVVGTSNVTSAWNVTSARNLFPFHKCFINTNVLKVAGTSRYLWTQFYNVNSFVSALLRQILDVSCGDFGGKCSVPLYLILNSFILLTYFLGGGWGCWPFDSPSQFWKRFHLNAGQRWEKWKIFNKK